MALATASLEGLAPSRIVAETLGITQSCAAPLKAVNSLFCRRLGAEGMVVWLARDGFASQRDERLLGSSRTIKDSNATWSAQCETLRTALKDIAGTARRVPRRKS